MRVLVIGASGFIGRYLLRRLSHIPGVVVAGTYRSRPPQSTEPAVWCAADLTEYASLELVFRVQQPQVVVLLAAVADVRTAEREPETATAINVGGTTHVAQLCSQHQARLIFVSSEYVFGHDRGNYREDDVPQPRFHYGRTKLEAEQAVARLTPEWSVVRTSLVYGWPLPGRRNMATVVKERLESGETFPGHANVYRTPIYVEHLTEGIARLVMEHHPGIQHLAGSDWVSMHQFAIAVADAFQLDRDLVVPALAQTGLGATSRAGDGSPEDEAPDLLGLDCTETMQRLGLRAYSVVEGLVAMRSRPAEFNP